MVLAEPLKKGESATITVAYGGKDVVMNEGGSNYYPVARESWYPNSAQGLGDYATYHMTFHVPKGLQLIATGTKVNDNTGGKITTTEWKTDVPLAVVGFNLGDFAMKEANGPGKLGDNLTIDAYANKNPPRRARPASARVASVPTNGLEDESLPSDDQHRRMLPVQLSQGEVAAQIYTDYFGPLPFATSPSPSSSPATTAKAGPCSSICPSADFSTAPSSMPSACIPKTCTGRSLRRTRWRTSGGARPSASAVIATNG